VNLSSDMATNPDGPVAPARASAVHAVVAMAILGALGWWAFKPLPQVTIEPIPHRAAPATMPGTDEPTRLALDLAAFQAPLWIAPPAPPAPAPTPKPEPPPPPLRLQILAIVRNSDDEQGDRALLYDPDTDKPIWVRGGQVIGSRTVERVSSDSVRIRDGTRLRTLALRERQNSGSLLEQSLRNSGGAK